MKQTQQELENLQQNKISEELKNEIAEHQRVLMEVQEIYGRFLFLLKLIVNIFNFMRITKFSLYCVDKLSYILFRDILMK